MINKLIDKYYDFFDKKLKQNIIVIVVILFLIIMIWLFIPNKSINYYWKVNILNSTKSKKIENIVTIDWKKYKLIFEEI